MKPWCVPLVLGCCFLAASGAVAQTPPRVTHADAAGSIGWITASTSQLSDYEDWSNSFFAAATAGWYWTDHLKTEVDAGVSTAAELNAVTTLNQNGRTSWRVSHYRISTRRLGVSQQYQAFRNAWFHPHLAAGVELNWETTRQSDDPVVIFDEATRQQRLITDARTLPSRTDLHVRPFAAGGFKAYLPERAFFRTDMRLVLDSGVRDVVVRFGFGADF